MTDVAQSNPNMISDAEKCCAKKDFIEKLKHCNYVQLEMDKISQTKLYKLYELKIYIHFFLTYNTLKHNCSLIAAI